MKFRNLLLILFLFLGNTLLAQREYNEADDPDFFDRVYFGGGGNLQMNESFLLIGASPIIGYMITPKFSSGLGVTYQYTRYKFLDQTVHTYGGRLFSRYNIFRSVYAMAEYEMLNLGLPRLSTDIPRQWVDRLMIGGGYFQAFPGGRGGFNLGVLYDVFFQYSSSYPYSSPWVYRVGFTF